MSRLALKFARLQPPRSSRAKVAQRVRAEWDRCLGVRQTRFHQQAFSRRMLQSVVQEIIAQSGDVFGGQQLPLANHRLLNGSCGLKQHIRCLTTLWRKRRRETVTQISTAVLF